MEKNDKFIAFLKARDQCVDNFKSLQAALIQCVDEKEIELEENLYNQTLTYLDGTPVVESWEELEEVVMQGKILEHEIDAWLSLHELTTYSLTWPKR